MEKTFNFLLVDDSAEDAELLVHHLKKSPWHFSTRQVDNGEDFQSALENEDWDLILCDFHLPRFDPVSALKILHTLGKDIPFIIVSGTVGEEKAVEAMRAGASDFVLKGHLDRLIPAIEREFKQAGSRRKKRETEQRLKKTQKILQHVISSVADVLWALEFFPPGEGENGEEYRVTYVSPNCEKIYGMGPDDFINRSKLWWELILPEEQEAALKTFQEAREKGMDVTAVYPIRNKLGEVKWIEDMMSPVRDETGRVISMYGTVRDITQRKEAEANYLRAKEELVMVQKLETIGQLSGGIAHDFNNILEIMIIHSEKIIATLEKEKNRDSSVYNSIHQMLKAAERGAGLTRKLLTFCRKQVIQSQVLNFHEIFPPILFMLQEILGDQVKLETNLMTKLWKVKLDIIQMEQILLNLVINARDAMKNGGQIQIRAKNFNWKGTSKGESIPGLPPGEYVLLTVQDTGSGIEPHILDRIFEPFFTTKAMGSGTGLGLSTVYGIVNQNGGHIKVTSTMGKGTTFELYFPRAEAELPPRAEKVKKVKSAPGRSGPKGKKRPTILLLEDQSDLRNILKEILQENGYKVITPLKASETLEIAKEKGTIIDLLITDVVMPDISGPVLAKMFNELRPNTKIIFMSGYLDKDLERFDFIGENAEYLEKPFSSKKILSKIGEILGKDS